MPASPTPSQAIEPPHWNPLVVTLVGVICTILLILSYYRLLQRHCSAFQGISFFGHQPQRRPLNEDNLEDPSIQLQSRELDSCIMHSIPITQFKKNSEEEELGQTKTDCAVCLGEFEEGEWIKNLPNCSHVFHVACIDMWFQAHSSCPLCRSYVDLEVDQEYSVSVYSLLETLRREELIQDRSAHYQVVQSHIFQTSSLRIDPQSAS